MLGYIYNTWHNNYSYYCHYHYYYYYCHYYYYCYYYCYIIYMYIYIIIYILLNYNNSPTWIKAIWGWFPLLTMIPVRSQWGRHKYSLWYEMSRVDAKEPCSWPHAPAEFLLGAEILWRKMGDTDETPKKWRKMGLFMGFQKQRKVAECILF